jgi:hypothetical protein
LFYRDRLASCRVMLSVYHCYRHCQPRS